MASENGSKKISVSISMSVDMDDALDAHSELFDCSKSDVVVAALKMYFGVQSSKCPSFVKHYARTARERLVKEE